MFVDNIFFRLVMHFLSLIKLAKIGRRKYETW